MMTTVNTRYTATNTNLRPLETALYVVVGSKGFWISKESNLRLICPGRPQLQKICKLCSANLLIVPIILYLNMLHQKQSDWRLVQNAHGSIVLYTLIYHPLLPTLGCGCSQVQTPLFDP